MPEEGAVAGGSRADPCCVFLENGGITAQRATSQSAKQHPLPHTLQLSQKPGLELLDEAVTR